MADIRLSLAISYYDHVSDLVRGRVKAEGITLIPSEFPVEEIFYRMVMFAEWDVAECSMAKYVALVGTGAPPFRAIPVFPSRVFRQSSVYVASRSGITVPETLRAGALAFQSGRRPPAFMFARILSTNAAFACATFTGSKLE